MAAPAIRVRAYPKFHEFMTLMRELHSAGGVGFRVKPVNDTQAVRCTCARQRTWQPKYSRRIGAMLGLTREHEFTVQYGIVPGE